MLFIYNSLLSATEFADSVNFRIQPDATFKTLQGNDYAVIEVPEKSKKGLYNAILIAVNSLYVSPNVEITKVEDNAITIKGYKSKFESVHFIVYASSDLTYTLQFQFKAEKIRIDAPIIREIITYQGTNIENLPVNTKPSLKTFDKKFVSDYLTLIDTNYDGNDKKELKKRNKAIERNKQIQKRIDHYNSFVNSEINVILQKSFETQESDW